MCVVGLTITPGKSFDMIGLSAAARSDVGCVSDLTEILASVVRVQKGMT